MKVRTIDSVQKRRLLQRFVDKKILTGVDLELKRACSRLLKDLEDCRDALRKIHDPGKWHHREPDDYTQLACAQFVAQECLKEVFGE